MRVHISLNVASLNNSLEFYRSLFGQEASKLKEGYANFRLEEPPIHLALVEDKNQAGEDVSHFGVEVPNERALHEWRDRLELTDAPFAVEDKASCCYATADKLWLTDPDGYKWEIWVRTGEFEAMGSVRIKDSSRTQTNDSCCVGSEA